METTNGGTFKICLEDMFKEKRNPKKHQERFKRKLLGDKLYFERHRRETDHERRERIKQDNANIQRVDNQIKK
jgi:hypothetical protein